ncbi:MAG: hypothetical protein JWO68_2382, partial [Actinomycetia bacterium]|nr:hypothetical protein [Actinomycetes bacterium]
MLYQLSHVRVLQRHLRTGLVSRPRSAGGTNSGTADVHGRGRPEPTETPTLSLAAVVPLGAVARRDVPFRTRLDACEIVGQTASRARP